MKTAEGSAVLDGEKVDADAHHAETIEIRSAPGNPVTGTDGATAVRMSLSRWT